RRLVRARRSCLPSPFALVGRGLGVGHVVEVAFEGVEAPRTHGPVRREPLVDLLKGLGPDPGEAPLGVDAGFYQPGVAEPAEVLGNGRLAYGKRIDELAHGPLTISEEVENPPPVPLRQYLEGGQHWDSIT